MHIVEITLASLYVVIALLDTFSHLRKPKYKTGMPNWMTSVYVGFAWPLFFSAEVVAGVYDDSKGTEK